MKVMVKVLTKPSSQSGYRDRYSDAGEIDKGG